MSTLFAGRVRRRGLWKFVALVVVLAIVVLAHNTTPDKGDFLQPVRVSAGADDVATTPEFSITVDRVRTTHTLRVPGLDGTSTLRSDIGWVVVTVTAAATKSPVSVLGARIKTRDGSTYLAGQRGDLSHDDLSSVLLSPELPIRCQVAVEMPASRVSGAHFETAQSYFQALEAVASVRMPHPTAEDSVTMAAPDNLQPGAVS